MTSGSRKLRVAVLVVNGKNSEYKGKLWLEPCLREILRNRMQNSLKIFLWNHDVGNPKVGKLVNKWSDWIALATEQTVSLDGVKSPKRRWREHSSLNFHGFHAHRTPLQLLYEIATGCFDPGIVVTFDTDSWPVRKGWDIMFERCLDSHKLAGVWRDELVPAIQPFVHPSGLAVRPSTISKLRLRFDTWPANRGEDTLSHFSRKVYARFGTNSIAKLRRSNARQWHTVAGGLYGGWIYHHHLGTRFTNKLPSIFKGSNLRGETAEGNDKIMREITDRVFFDYQAYMEEVRGVKCE